MISLTYSYVLYPQSRDAIASKKSTDILRACIRDNNCKIQIDKDKDKRNPTYYVCLLYWYQKNKIIPNNGILL